MSQDRVMLLIDADNVSLDIIEQAVLLLHKQHGGVHVRRAYCTAESAVKHQAAFKRLGIKPMVNLAAGKNSTDIALAVDAIDLVLAERPDVVVIASSDSDFAPLVQRLREKGCEVRGIGQLGKTGQETQEVYDDYTVLEHHKAQAERPAAAKKVARKAAAKKTDKPAAAAKKAPAAKKAAAKRAASKTTTAAARKTPARKRAAAAGDAAPSTVAVSGAAPAAAPVAAPNPPGQDAPVAAPRNGRADSNARSGAGSAGRATPRATLDAVLACLPELQAGRSLPLSTAARRLRDAQLLGESSKSTKLFAHWPQRFDLVPADHPSEVRLRAA